LTEDRRSSSFCIPRRRGRDHAAGNLTSLTDADSSVTTFAYDAANRQTSQAA
jgi:YD repeat-containing protein